MEKDSSEEVLQIRTVSLGQSLEEISERLRKLKVRHQESDDALEAFKTRYSQPAS